MVSCVTQYDVTCAMLLETYHLFLPKIITLNISNKRFSSVHGQGRPCGAGGLRRHSKRGPIVYNFFFYL